MRPTMHAVGLYSLDCLQIVGVGSLLIINNNGNWKSEHRRLTCIGTIHNSKKFIMIR